MFKKLLTVGALAVGITLTGGVGSALALEKCPSQNINKKGSMYTRHVVNTQKKFANAFEQKYSGKTIKWYLKGVVKSCNYNGRTAYAAYYEGRAK
ncbi:hypothetical protein GPY51_20295 [Photorhabdus laumondii subsp. laumondii]|uniref:Photorhabdus luminescens subsp. laumondii TTO1 complete genome segment 8/17 n=2 Tax=Photorhabdus laumondii subsp. laumondii TaxID=141679 RepID=Q7N4R5_PHOLL|nr:MULTISPECIES: hypothetical protein [Photorhabdus]AWK42030.1 hypothetical protein A4R40_11305 [Photorhabdus laumondii subsp. laumondii]AXG47352.1 hypothetical protein PluTT01m_11640 [Photorhabdus laumondii subsp. laumondii]KTL60059.1 hypothetical protein AA106_14555 [Photorhabdus laumondii subsp. laumondii]MCC8386241.1 hypothetical protein [Photorhabdus laumondii]MCC8414073.1 hypothetical protein [Photorhabdus laumondii]